MHLRAHKSRNGLNCFERFRARVRSYSDLDAFNSLLNSNRTSPQGTTSITLAEIVGIIYGLRMAWNVGIRRLRLQVDSHSAIKLISGRVGSTHPTWNLVERVRELLHLEWSYVMCIYFVWDTLPTHILSIIGYGTNST